MKKVLHSTSDSFREKGSKFTGFLFPAKNKRIFEEELEKIKSKYPDATHHCYAWRLNPTKLEEFAQDDGEPGGTAGLPILNQMKSFEVINAGLVVVRYYGGTKLGKSGLIDAYGHAALLCLSKAQLKSIQLIRKVQIVYPYPEQNAIEKLTHQFDLQELETSYLEEVTLTIACPLEFEDPLLKQLKQITHRGIEFDILEEGYI